MKTQTFEQLKKQLQKEETELEASLENRALMRAARDLARQNGNSYQTELRQLAYLCFFYDPDENPIKTIRIIEKAKRRKR